MQMTEDRFCACGCGARVYGKRLYVQHHNASALHQQRGQRIDMIGRVFGRLTVIARAPNRSQRNRYYWECLCECGKTHVVRTDALRCGNVSSCGCLSLELRRKYANPDRTSIAFTAIYATYRNGARGRGYDFGISKEQFCAIITQNCHYCDGAPSNTVKTSYKPTQVEMKYNGVDRIDNNFGYTPDNCVACCRRCNMAKNDMTYQEYIDLCRRVAARHGGDSNAN